MQVNHQLLEVKKFAFKFILLICIFVLADFIIGNVLKYYYFKINSGQFYNITFALDSTDAKTLVFGSSRASHHYIPKNFENQLNTTFFNCGCDDEGLIYEAAMIKAITARYMPKTILVDLLPNEFTIDKSDYLSKLLPYKDNSAIYPYILEKTPYERIKLLSKSYSFNSLFVDIIKGNLRKNQKMVDTKGHIALKNTMDSTKSRFYQGEEGNISYKKVGIYENLLQYLNETNITTYIIISPFYDPISTNRSPRIAENLCKKYKNIHFISFLHASYLENYKLYADRTHLNNRGAFKFSNELCTYIKASENK